MWSCTSLPATDEGATAGLNDRPPPGHCRWCAVRRDLRADRHRLHADLRRHAQAQHVLCGRIDRRGLLRAGGDAPGPGAALAGLRRGHRRRGRDRLSGVLDVLSFHSARLAARHPDGHRRHAVADRRDHRAHHGGHAAALSGGAVGAAGRGRRFHAARRSDVGIRRMSDRAGGADDRCFIARGSVSPPARCPSSRWRRSCAAWGSIVSTR